ncbi:hypothetical protein [Actibacterium sp. D379-3]
MAEVTVQELADGIAGLMERRLHVGGHGLPAKVRRAGRLLPGHVRRDAQAIADALALADNPRLMRQIDLPRLEAAERRVTAWLKTVDPNKRRIDTGLSILGGIAFSVIAVFAAVVAVLVWRGYV